MKTLRYILMSLLAAILLEGVAFARTDSLTVAVPSDTLLVAELPLWRPGDLEKKGTGLAIDGLKLSAEEQRLILSDIGGEDLNPLWRKYVRQRNIGLWTTVAGGTVFAAGMIYGGALVVIAIDALPVVIALAEIFTLGNADAGEVARAVLAEATDKAKAGAIVAGAGLTVAIPGVVLLLTGSRNLRKTVAYCNSIGAPQEAAFQFGPTASGGIGLTFNF